MPIQNWFKKLNSEKFNSKYKILVSDDESDAILSLHSMSDSDDFEDVEIGDKESEKNPKETENDDSNKRKCCVS